MKRGNAEDARLERWGAWRVGAGLSGAPKVATWAGLRSSSLANWASSDEAVPRTYLEERETHGLIAFLAARHDTADLARFALAAYPTQYHLAQKLGIDKRALAEKRKQLWRVLGRLRSQRKEGEPLDPGRRRRSGKVVEVRATVAGRRKPVLIASAVQPD
jgi:hypothetical protein